MCYPYDILRPEPTYIINHHKILRARHDHAVPSRSSSPSLPFDGTSGGSAQRLYRWSTLQYSNCCQIFPTAENVCRENVLFAQCIRVLF